MNQFYNPQGFQPYGGGQQIPAGSGPGTMSGQQFQFQPQPQQQPGVPQFPPAGAGAGFGTSMQPAAPGSQVPGMLPIEQSYIENILRLNKGKLVSVFATFEGNNQWNAREFKGIIEAAGRDHVILSDSQTGARFLIPMVAVDYVQFSEEIEYDYPGFGGGPTLSTFPPR